MIAYQSYTPVEAKWVGTIPDHWQFLRVKELLAERKEKNHPVVTEFILSLSAASGVTPYHERTEKGGNKPKDNLALYNVARENDLLVNCMNIVSGAAGVTKWDGAISPVYYALYPRKSDCDIRFIEYIFRLLSFQRSLVGLGKGIQMHESDSGTLTTVRMRIPMSNLNSVCIPTPSLAEQTQIVRYLDWQTSRLNTLINARKRQVTLLREAKQAAINEAVTPQRHWKVVKIKRLFSEATERNAELTAPLLTFSRSKGLIPFAEKTNRTFEASDLSKYRLVDVGQLLMNRMQAWNGMFICVDKYGCVSPDYSVFDRKIDIDVKFYEYLFRLPSYIKKFANASKGIGDGFNRLYTPQFGEITTVLPPFSEQQSIVAELDRKCSDFDKAIEANNQQIALLTEYRTRLVSDVVTGKVDVRGVAVPEYERVEAVSEGEDTAEAQEGDEE